MADLNSIGGIHYEMMKRCYNEKSVMYSTYGAVGITVCEEWSGKDGFFNFRKWANENSWVKGLTLDRENNDKGYSPSNCRWVTRLQQEYNKRNNILYDYAGYKMPLGMIAKLEEVKYGLLYTRVRQKNMSVAEALADIRKSTD